MPSSSSPGGRDASPPLLPPASSAGPESVSGTPFLPAGPALHAPEPPSSGPPVPSGMSGVALRKEREEGGEKGGG